MKIRSKELKELSNNLFLFHVFIYVSKSVSSLLLNLEKDLGQMVDELTVELMGNRIFTLTTTQYKIRELFVSLAIRKVAYKIGKVFGSLDIKEVRIHSFYKIF